jgi:hypothetical protein
MDIGMNQLKPRLAQYSLFFLLLLFSIELKDLLIIKKEIIQKATTTVPTVEDKKSQTVKAAKVKLKKFVIAPLDLLDRDAFLASFQRQAQESLLTCLRTNMGQGSVLFSGVLSKKGQFRKLEQIGDSKSVRYSNSSAQLDNSLNGSSKCVETAIFKMDFSAITKNFQASSLEIQWRVDF